MVSKGAPKGVDKEPVQIRLPVETVEKIDDLIRQGKYSSRSDFVYQLVIRELSSNNAALIEKMDDPEVKAKIQEICKEIFSNVFSK
jgi:Arc/MetJ-type ribon-helix-helix transcriptional regulator